MGADGEMSLRLFIGGMRGSRPATGAAFEEFGGDTTSLLLVGSRGERLVLDAGTGMHAVAGQLARTGPGEVTVLFSHYHLDHMAGLTMNPLFYQPGWSFRFLGPTFADGGVRDAVTRLLAPPYWPMSVERMSARLEFAEFATDGIQVGQLRVRGCPVPHPGGCLAYRIDDTDGGDVARLRHRSRMAEADERRGDGVPGDCAASRDRPICSPSMRTSPGPTGKRLPAGGTASWEDGLEIAESAGIRAVLLGHHAPDADDKALHALEQQVKKRSPGSMLARAGQWLTIGG